MPHPGSRREYTRKSGIPSYGERCLYGVPLYRQAVFVDESLAAEERIVFNARTHGDAIMMRYEDFAAIAKPTVGRFAERAEQW
jgi:hypothetical protein